MRLSSAHIDMLLGAGALLVAALLFHGASKVPPPIFDPLGSGFVPKIAALVIAALGATILAQGAAEARRKQELAPAASTANLAVAFGMLALCVAYAALMRPLGFAIATTLFVAAASWLLGRGDRKTLLFGGLLAPLLGFGGAALFTHVVYIDLP